ncbi:MAG: glutathione S-transferase family protein [Burkholderiales bacterium]|nr:glutathione S-transferase family protein [Burkholderiales bacterium]
MIKLLGRSSSINVRKVLWTLAELEATYEHEEWGTAALPLKSPAFLALNPNALVPVLEHDGLILSESNTICRYLAARFGRQDLLPALPAERARVEQWMDWQATELNNAWRYAFMGLVRKSPVHQDRLAIGDSLASWNRHMVILDTTLARTGAYVTGPVFTLADVPLGLSVHRWYMTPFERPQLAAVAAYYALLSQRPGYARHGRNELP